MTTSAKRTAPDIERLCSISAADLHNDSVRRRQYEREVLAAFAIDDELFDDFAADLTHQLIRRGLGGTAVRMLRANAAHAIVRDGLEILRDEELVELARNHFALREVRQMLHFAEDLHDRWFQKFMAAMDQDNLSEPMPTAADNQSGSELASGGGSPMRAIAAPVAGPIPRRDFRHELASSSARWKLPAAGIAAVLALAFVGTWQWRANGSLREQNTGLREQNTGLRRENTGLVQQLNQLISVTTPANDAKVSQRIDIQGQIKVQGWPVVFVQPLDAEQAWWVQDPIEELPDGKFSSVARFGDSATRAGTKYLIVIVVVDSRAEAVRFKPGRYRGALPAGLLTSPPITVVRE